MPPPMPSSPARKPATTPSASSSATSAQPMSKTRRHLRRPARQHGVPLGVGDRRDRQPVAAAQHAASSASSGAVRISASGSSRVLRTSARRSAASAAARRGRVVEVRAGGVELRGRAARPAMRASPAMPGWRRTSGRRARRHRLHLVAHEVARLVVAHAGPGQRLLRRAARSSIEPRRARSSSASTAVAWCRACAWGRCKTGCKVSVVNREPHS
jgi:hypothetical protein